MKGPIATARVIAIVSLALMLFFWYVDPVHPPSPFEVKLWVGVVAVLVTSIKAIWVRVRALGSVP